MTTEERKERRARMMRRRRLIDRQERSMRKTLEFCARNGGPADYFSALHPDLWFAHVWARKEYERSMK